MPSLVAGVSTFKSVLADHLRQLDRFATRRGAAKLKGVYDQAQKDDKFVSVLCARCHDCVHERERALEAGETPKPMPGQKKENAE